MKDKYYLLLNIILYTVFILFKPFLIDERSIICKCRAWVPTVKLTNCIYYDQIKEKFTFTADIFFKLLMNINRFSSTVVRTTICLPVWSSIMRDVIITKLRTYFFIWGGNTWHMGFYFESKKSQIFLIESNIYPPPMKFLVHDSIYIEVFIIFEVVSHLRNSFK